jgi:hypothetical protein
MWCSVRVVKECDLQFRYLRNVVLSLGTLGMWCSVRIVKECDLQFRYLRNVVLSLGT